MQNSAKLGAVLTFAASILGASTAFAQTATPSGQTVNATSTIASSLTLTVVDRTVVCGTIALGQPTACGSDKANANVTVTANTDWALEFEDLGGAASGAADGEATLFAPIGRNGQFVLDVDLSVSSGAAGADIPVAIAPVGIRGSGGAAEQFDATDDYGDYFGETLLTLSEVL